jgi:hypothetical protein
MYLNKYSKIHIFIYFCVIFILIWTILDISVKKKIINNNCDNKKYILFNNIKNTLKTGDIIQLKTCLGDNLKEFLHFAVITSLLTKKITFNSMYYHSLMIIKQNNILYGVDFIPKKYFIYKSKFLRKDKQGIRIFVLEDYLKLYYNKYKNISRVLYTKKYIDNIKFLNIIKNLKNKTFKINGLDILFKLNEKKNKFKTTLFCTEFIAVILKKLKFLSKKFKTYYFTPEKIITLTKKPHNLYTLGPEFKYTNN